MYELLIRLWCNAATYVFMTDKFLGKSKLNKQICAFANDSASLAPFQSHMSSFVVYLPQMQPDNNFSIQSTILANISTDIQ